MAEAFEVLSARFSTELERRNFRPRTVIESSYNLILLERFLKERQIRTPESITAAVLTDFQRWLFYQPTQYGGVRTVASQNRVLSTVKSLFKFLKREGYLPSNPAEDLEHAREPRSLPRNVLTPQEARRILESIDTSFERGYRDRTLMEVFYATGLRRTELLNLTVENVNLEEELLRINDGKGGKDRVVPLTQTACQFLETYIKGIRPAWAKKTGTDRLFISWRGRPMDANTLGVLVVKHAQQAGIKKRVTCHVWRHSCATHLLKNQANLRHVQEILGHRSLATTERYLHLTITDLKEAHRKHHPREALARGHKREA
jgi:integrase/recombinase XerD